MAHPVLILVFVEDGMIATKFSKLINKGCSLNPCFCGRWNDSPQLKKYMALTAAVLILVFVEDGMIEQKPLYSLNSKRVLILVFVEDGMIANTI